MPAINLLRSSFGTNSLVTMADSALYDVLGVSSKATDTELKKVEILKESKIDIHIFFYLKTSYLAPFWSFLSFNSKHVLPLTAFIWPPSHGAFFLNEKPGLN